MKTVENPQLIFDTDTLIKGFDSITPYDDSTINEIIEDIWENKICFVQTDNGLSTDKKDILLTSTENPVFITDNELINFLDLVNGKLLSEDDEIEDEESPEGEYFMYLALDHIKTHQTKAYLTNNNIQFKEKDD